MHLTEHAITIDGKSARYYQYLHHDHTTKPTIHFYGGNGFAVGSYQPLLSLLSEHYNIVSLAMAGCWYEKPTDTKRTREQDADLLIEFLQATQNQPVIAVAHSQGATSTALACAKRPELFSQLFLIEPVTFTARQSMLYKRLPRWFMMLHEPFKSTAVKQSKWQSVDEYYQYLRQKNAYKRVSDKHLYIYAQNNLVADTEGFQLLFSPQQELANYFGVPYIDGALQAINNQDKPIPYTLIVGKPSIFISEKVRKNWAKFIKDDQMVVLSEYGHLLPIEAPKLVAEEVLANVSYNK